MKKKVKLISFNHALNYGAILQTYGLLEKVKELGYDTEVIDYRPLFLTRTYRKIGKNPYNNLKRFLNKYLFYKFSNKHLSLTKEVYKTENDLIKSPPHADVYITGSDQIWNYNFVKNDLKSFFLQFGNKDTKRVSYAASMGATNFPSNTEEEIQRYLNTFNHITVREKCAQDNVNKLVNKEAQIAIDPSLFSIDYNKISKEPKLDDYIVVYCVGYSLHFRQMILELKKHTNKKVVNIGTSYLKEADKNVFLVSPGEWLGWIKKASLVYTNSFHGTVFAIKNKRNFAFVPQVNPPAINNRVYDLLNILNLNDRITTEENIPTVLESDINYNSVMPILEEMISGSEKILKNALNS